MMNIEQAFKENKGLKLVIIAIVVVLVLYYFNFAETSLTYEKGSDEQFHLVRDLPDKEEAAEIMGEIKRRLQLLINYCVTNFPNDTNVQQMKQRFKTQNIQETDLSDSGTSYSIDKGKEINLCIRDKATARLHQINILMFVSIHELAHVMATSYGHNGEFGDRFVFLLKQATKIGIYKAVDYSKKNVNFCGMDVTDSPLF